MPKGDAEFLEALICYVGQNEGVDVVLSKALRILGHAELFEPIRHFFRRCRAHPKSPSSKLLARTLLASGQALRNAAISWDWASGRVPSQETNPVTAIVCRCQSR